MEKLEYISVEKFTVYMNKPQKSVSYPSLLELFDTQ